MFLGVELPFLRAVFANDCFPPECIIGDIPADKDGIRQRDLNRGDAGFDIAAFFVCPGEEPVACCGNSSGRGGGHSGGNGGGGFVRVFLRGGFGVTLRFCPRGEFRQPFIRAMRVQASEPALWITVTAGGEICGFRGAAGLGVLGAPRAFCV